jgi:hypothetical protein
MKKLASEINRNGFLYKQIKIVFGVELPEKEKFPGDEDFGKCAWTYPDIEKALNKFRQIENGEI